MADRARISHGWPLAVAWLLACGASATVAPPGGSNPRPPPSPSSDPAAFIAPEEACSSDDECVVTDFPGCCACCGCAVPYAMRRDALAAERERCAVIDCAMECDEECERCPLGPTGAAVCDRGRCTHRLPPR